MPIKMLILAALAACTVSLPTARESQEPVRYAGWEQAPIGYTWVCEVDRSKCKWTGLLSWTTWENGKVVTRSHSAGRDGYHTKIGCYKLKVK